MQVCKNHSYVFFFLVIQNDSIDKLFTNYCEMNQSNYTISSL